MTLYHRINQAARGHYLYDQEGKSKLLEVQEIITARGAGEERISVWYPLENRSGTLNLSVAIHLEPVSKDEAKRMINAQTSRKCTDDFAPTSGGGG